MTADLPETESVLAEHLFKKVCDIDPDNASQITGILLESSRVEILKMLENEHLLKERCGLALASVNSASDVEDDLFLSVQHIEPDLAEKLTGMVLELGQETVKNLLASPDKMREAVAKAKQAYLEYLGQAEGSEMENQGSTEELGEYLYSEVERIYPSHAPKLTGMLLEMSEADLKDVLADRTRLKTAVDMAYKVLMNSR